MPSKSKKKQENALTLYEDALERLHDKKYTEASKLLEKIRHDYPSEADILARAEGLERLCEVRQQEEDTSGAGAETLYTSGLVEHNDGNYEGAVEYFQKALKASKSDGDYIYFALAAAEARRGNEKEALQHLKKSLELNGDNRFLAQRDRDFESLSGVEGFRKLVWPGSRD